MARPRQKNRFRLTPLVIAAILLSTPVSSPAAASDVRCTLGIDLINITGHTTNRTTFDGGESALRWPIDMALPRMRAGIVLCDDMEGVATIAARPWMSGDGVMKDYDYLDEGASMPLHTGLDVYSETPVDSKGQIISFDMGYFPLHSTFVKAGLVTGYRREEYDYRGYNSRQMGFGPWNSYTARIHGPSTIYSVDYDVWYLGVAVSAGVPSTFSLDVTASAIPLAQGSDEDEHLRRNRVTFTDTKGHGYLTTFTGTFAVYRGWKITSSFSYQRISTHGHQDQYWYGDDPLTSGADDTGYGLKGLRARLEQEHKTVSIGWTYGL